MDVRAFIDAVGINEAKRVAEAAGSNYAYLSQIASGVRRPSVELADRLVRASDNRLDFEKLLRSKLTPQQQAAAA